MEKSFFSTLIFREIFFIKTKLFISILVIFIKLAD